MPDHKDYQSAMDKVAPSDAWKAATLEKMAAARAQQEKPKAAPRLRVAKKVGIPLAAAAAVALLAVPAAVQSGVLSASGGTSAPSTALFSAAAYNETAPGTARTEDALQDEAQAKAAPTAPRDFDLGEHEGLPVLVLGDDSGGMGGGVTFVADSVDDVRGDNPTWNLSPSELPETLPVWHAQSGENADPLTDLLNLAAEAFGLPLVQDETEEAPTGYPSPDLWPYSLFGDLMDPEHWDEELPLHEQTDPSKAKVWSVSASGTTVSGYRNGEGESDDHQAGDDAALALLAGAAGIEQPAHQHTLATSFEGEVRWAASGHFYFENSGSTVTERLLNYSFRRVSGAVDSTGALRSFSLTLPPETQQVGDYPLRSVEEAKAALQVILDEEQASGMREYDLSVEQVEGWQLEYAQSSMNPYIQPVYRFYLKTELTPEDAFYENAQGNVYVSYTVSALPDGYCVPFEEVFN
ncbi:MAG TPA: hypothetical protein H9813_10240 [Candidatus Fournierella merdipullorum]|uniref:Uncharacterized protein n=1 Tax=Candidatus Allofournierella merdipullorum TaxID=2838595 RepID=A0A9D2E694_9FIRM|nr:hypothetical protein [Candidatus Fournierella merdipullorum]